ncbi:MAG: permease, partial [Chloroflexi bacterium]
MEILNWIIGLLQGGLGNLAAYLAAHVLLCLLPAFFIAGGMTALIPKESVTRFLGRKAPKYVSYPAAALAGSLLAVCSCTIVPLFAGIHKKGAGLGPAITFLFFAPAANILALAYTGVAIGPDLAFSRLFLSLAFGIGIGLIMALIFSRSDAQHDQETDETFAGKRAMRPGKAVFLLLLAALLIAGTLKVDLLTGTYATVTLPAAGMDRFQDWLYQLVPFDAAKGEEGVSAQGAILIGLLALIGLSAWKGFEQVFEGINRWVWVAFGLITLTLMFAALKVTPHVGGLDLGFTGRMFAVAVLLLAAALVVRREFGEEDLRDWL